MNSHAVYRLMCIAPVRVIVYSFHTVLPFWFLWSINGHSSLPRPPRYFYLRWLSTVSHRCGPTFRLHLVWCECGGGRENFVLFFTPPPKYFGASDTCHRPPFPITMSVIMCKEKMIFVAGCPSLITRIPPRRKSRARASRGNRPWLRNGLDTQIHSTRGDRCTCTTAKPESRHQ